MFSIANRMMNSREEAEDMIQEAFTYVFMKLHTFRNESSIGAWIKRIVVNQCINELKRKRIALSFEESIEKYDLADDNETAESQYSVENIKEALNALPDGYRVITSLYLFEGYDHSEISQILNISESTSKSQYHRAKKKMNELINAQVL